MTTTAVGVMPIHNTEDPSLPGAPKLQPEKKRKRKKDKIKSNMLKRLKLK